MKRGMRGNAGSAMYFAESADLARRMSSKRGVVLKVKVCHSAVAEITKGYVTACGCVLISESPG